MAPQLETDSPAFSTSADYFLSSGLPVDNYLYTHSSSPFSMSHVPPISQTSPRMGFNSLSLSTGSLPDYYASPPPFSTPTRSSPRSYPHDSISPPLTTNVNGSDLSDGRHSRGSNASGSPSSVHGGGTLVHRNHPARYTTTSSNGIKDRRRRPSKSDDLSDDNEDGDYQPIASSDVLIQKRREEIRRQRIESEQRRRDELRDGYRRLKEVLPVSNQKSSKVSLLDRATVHIKFLEMTQQQLQSRLTAAEIETQRLRQVNETLMLSAAEHRSVASQPPPPAY